MPLGGQAIQANYNPAGNFLGSIAAITELVLLAPDFTISLASPAITVQTQHHTTTTVTLTGLNAFADSLTLSCGNSSAYITCKFTPDVTLLAGNGTATVSLYLDTDSVLGYALTHPTPAPRSSQKLPFNFALLFLPLGFLARLIVSPVRTTGRLHLLVLLLAILPLALTLTGCNSLISAYDIPPSVPPGTYTVAITATGATTGISHTSQLTLTVTP